MYKKYIFIIAIAIISGCQQNTIANFNQFPFDNSTFNQISTCETKTLIDKEFKDIWHRIRSGLCFKHINSSRINKELMWMKKNKEFVYRSIERARHYLFHIQIGRASCRERV